MIVKKIADAFVAVSDIAARPQDYQSLFIEIDRLSAAVQHHVKVMTERSSALNLVVNLHVISRLMLERSISTVIPDGVTKEELETLNECDRRLTVPARIAVHELMNLRERQQFVETFRRTFNRYKSRGE
jgi:hypothetical protein